MKIPIKKYIDDETLSWKERYEKLSLHHKEETEWLIGEVKRLEKLLCSCGSKKEEHRKTKTEP